MSPIEHDHRKSSMPVQTSNAGFCKDQAMQDELHQFDRLKDWELFDKPFAKRFYSQEEGIDFEESLCSISIALEAVRIFLLPTAAHNSFLPSYQMDVENGIFLMVQLRMSLCCQPEKVVDTRSSRKKSTFSGKLVWIKQAPRAC
ncbi:hypothetical protein Tco_0906618 [Tanacetum coccineum]|uniref:Uncharacterized protein n=1 Tax=Tanacetum coccineum TaxID=301880 RepID=A0ABQ4YYC8_9ASTR